MNNLTEQEQNVIKDILKAIGNDSSLENAMAEEIGMSEEDFASITDSIFLKLGNGRVTVQE